MINQIIDLLTKNFSDSLSQAWNSLVLWRGIALILALLIAIAYLRRDKIFKLLNHQSYIDHDRKIFTQSDGVMSELEMCHFLDNLENNHAYYLDDIIKLDGLIEFFWHAGNQYLDNKLINESKDLIQNLDKLTNFVAMNFYEYPDKQERENVRLVMQPTLNIDIEGDDPSKYVPYSNKLTTLVRITRIAYRHYRTLIQKKLLV